MPITTADGQRKWLLIGEFHKRNAEGDVIGSVGIHEDVTDRKMVEENLRESRDEARAAEKAEQEFLSPDEPRDPDPDERHHGHGGFARRHPTRY